MSNSFTSLAVKKFGADIIYQPNERPAAVGLSPPVNYLHTSSSLAS